MLLLRNQNTFSVLWFKMVNILPKKTDKMLFGCVYIPPENTWYSSDTTFHELEDELIVFSGNVRHVFLLGDFNARTSVMQCFVLPDENFINILGVDDDEQLSESIFSYQKIVELNIPLERSSEDRVRHNRYGVKMAVYLRIKILDVCM